jgi:uncharacterized protein YndB with AHSA1/START domain
MPSILVAAEDAMPSLEHTVEIDAPASVVWRVLTTRELVREWAESLHEGIDIRCAWREGGAVEWKGCDGTVLKSGVVGAFEPRRLLRFDYEAGEPPARSFSDAWSLSGERPPTTLTFATGPLSRARCAELRDAHRDAAETIKSLAEEAARIGVSRH